jgi:glutamate--cysteine ligase
MVPTHNRKRALGRDEAVYRAGRRAFTAAGPKQCVGCVGLEPEFLPVRVGAAGGPAGRLPLQGDDRSVMGVVDGLAGRSSRVIRNRAPVVGPREYALAQGGRLTFEPGAQVEHSTAVRASAAEALSDVQGVHDLLQAAFAATGASLAAIGLDLWHDVETVPQQLDHGRYHAQAAFYSLRGPWGAVMMRNTASLQLNLDLGADGVWQERWRLAYLLSPLITATFACSPGDGAVCRRAQAWQRLDPSRTGFPRLLVENPDGDPHVQWAEAALAADVMLYRLSSTVYEAGAPGVSFEQWMRDGHPRFGWPTLDDLDYHLTTLFFEVRPRGFFELRACEALPDRWRAAPVVLVTALLYDPAGRDAAMAELVGNEQRLPELWQRAAEHGVRDAEIGPLAARVWSHGLAAAERMPGGFFGDRAIAVARDFLEHFVDRGRMPADDLADLLTKDPARALSWATSGWSERVDAP